MSYNTITYISQIIAFLIMIIIGIDLFYNDNIIQEKFEFPVTMVGVSLSSLYYKYHTVAITEAIKDFWRAKTNKNNDDSQTYDEYKSKKK